MAKIITISCFLSFLFASCCYNDYGGGPGFYYGNPEYENHLVCADTSNRILSVHYPAISRTDSNINANKTKLLLPTDATASIVVTTLKKTDSIWVSSKLSIKLDESDYFCGNRYEATNDFVILRTTADSVKINTRNYSLYRTISEKNIPYGYTLIIYQN